MIPFQDRLRRFKRNLVHYQSAPDRVSHAVGEGIMQIDWRFRRFAPQELATVDSYILAKKPIR